MIEKLTLRIVPMVCVALLLMGMEARCTHTTEPLSTMDEGFVDPYLNGRKYLNARLVDCIGCDSALRKDDFSSDCSHTIIEYATYVPNNFRSLMTSESDRTDNIKQNRLVLCRSGHQMGTQAEFEGMEAGPYPFGPDKVLTMCPV